MEDNDANGQGDAAPGAALSDGQLVRATLSGRREAFDELIRRHQRSALSVSYQLLGNLHDAQEVTQDAFRKAYGGLKTMEDPDRFRAWLMRTVRNESLNRRRDRRRLAQLPTDDMLDGGDAAGAGAMRTSRADDPLQKVARREVVQRVRVAISQLPEKQREAIVMFTMEKMPQKEMAEALGCSVEAVKWRVFEARRMLREILKDVLTEQ